MTGRPPAPTTLPLTLTQVRAGAQRTLAMVPVLRAAGLPEPRILHTVPVLAHLVALFEVSVSAADDEDHFLAAAGELGWDSLLVRRAHHRGRRLTAVTGTLPGTDDAVWSEWLDLLPAGHEVALTLAASTSSTPWMGGFLEAVHDVLVGEAAQLALGGAPPGPALLARPVWLGADGLSPPARLLESTVTGRYDRLRDWALGDCPAPMLTSLAVLLTRTTDPAEAARTARLNLDPDRARHTITAALDRHLAKLEQR